MTASKLKSHVPLHGWGMTPWPSVSPLERGGEEDLFSLVFQVFFKASIGKGLTYAFRAACSSLASLYWAFPMNR